ncbi:TadE/TadG family type IV pilus assembly protein [Thaumasiovibrio subtropicus]|uniref:TadE/TadG family type IV pilus assembly protein n=1 Tax=Thaumasiovibrio subtropicus TaxID=1891207 RepID=UPI000B35343D|nr:hypothetical protein [Thaumasiovibrio subtropicus]
MKLKSKQRGSVTIEGFFFIPVVLVLIFALADIAWILRADNRLQDVTNILTRAISQQGIPEDSNLQDQVRAYEPVFQRMFADEYPGQFGVTVTVEADGKLERASFGDCIPPVNEAQLPTGNYWRVSSCFVPTEKVIAVLAVPLITSDRMLYNHVVYKRR